MVGLTNSASGKGGSVISRRALDAVNGIRKYWYCYLMMAGTIVLLFTFAYLPAMSALYHSFTIWDAARPSRWAGLDNFQELVELDLYRKAFSNLALLWIWAVVRGATFPLLGAALIYRFRRESTAYYFRLLFVLPIVVPFVVRVLVWKEFFEPTVGFLNAALGAVGLEGSLWLYGMKTALPSLMFAEFPWIEGVSMLIFLAGLLNIPNETIEAAIVDGASGPRRFFAIELPLIIPQLRITVVLSTIRSLQDFGWQLLATSGGPINATTVPAYEMYKEAIINNRYGMASAIGVVLFVLIFTLTLINRKTIRSATEYQA